ncbi:MAG TPA: hypothetical protein VEW06_06290 [Xanthobacteraceae bacterium]|nr:hypothetical protein [Xanthobacteraceae bacterium]
MRAATTPVIDWAAHPEPWRTIGLRFWADCEAIARGEPLPPLRRRKGGPKVNFVAPAEVPPEGA